VQRLIPEPIRLGVHPQALQHAFGVHSAHGSVPVLSGKRLPTLQSPMAEFHHQNGSAVPAWYLLKNVPSLTDAPTSSLYVSLPTRR